MEPTQPVVEGYSRGGTKYVLKINSIHSFIKFHSSSWTFVGGLRDNYINFCWCVGTTNQWVHPSQMAIEKEMGTVEKEFWLKQSSFILPRLERPARECLKKSCLPCRGFTFKLNRVTGFLPYCNLRLYGIIP